jgi:hypothetical protein
VPAQPLGEGVAVNYIDAGYAIALGTLAAYAALLWHRYRRLERLAESAREDE